LRRAPVSRKFAAQLSGPKKMLRQTAAATVFLLLCACSSGPDLVSPEKIAGFKTGSTNQTEIVAALGKPTHTIAEADGTKIDQYPYAGGAVGGGSFLPSYLGGDSTPNKYGMVSFSYGAGGVLKSIDTGK
jgi:hypothetical protein